MGYKQPSSGLPFKEIGSSPAKQKIDLHKAEAHTTSVRQPVIDSTSTDQKIWDKVNAHPEIKKSRDDSAKEFFKERGYNVEGSNTSEGKYKKLGGRMAKKEFKNIVKTKEFKNREQKPQSTEMGMSKEEGKLKKKFVGPKNKITQKKSTDFDPKAMGTN